MAEYDRALEYAHEWQDEASLSLSVAATSGAPTGTRGIGAETTTGWEPVTAHRVQARGHHVQGARADERTTHTTSWTRPSRAAQARATSSHGRRRHRGLLLAGGRLRAPLPHAGVRAGAHRPGDQHDDQPPARDDGPAERRTFGETLIQVPARAARHHGLPGRCHRRAADHRRRPACARRDGLASADWLVSLVH
jgi:hypothetical protein